VDVTAKRTRGSAADIDEVGEASCTMRLSCMVPASATHTVRTCHNEGDETSSLELLEKTQLASRQARAILQVMESNLQPAIALWRPRLISATASRLETGSPCPQG